MILTMEKIVKMVSIKDSKYLQILKVGVRGPQEAMHEIRKLHPFARLVTYKFGRDFRKTAKDYGNRTVTVIFVKDIMEVRDLM